jgi:hypothetical protein
MTTRLPRELEPLRKISVAKAAALNDVSEDTFRRRFAHLILSVSNRRQAVRLQDAIEIGKRPNHPPEAA